MSNPSLTKNTFLLISLQLCAKILLAFWTFFLAHKLGAEGYGLWANVMAVATIFSPLQDMGVSLIFIREISQDRSRTRHYFGYAMVLYPMLSVLFLALTVASGLFLHYDAHKLMLLGLGGLSFSALVPLLASQVVLVGHENFRPYILATFIGTLGYLGIGVVLVHLGFHVTGVILAMCLGNLCSSFWITRKTASLYGAPEFGIDGAALKRYIWLGLPIMLSSLLYEASIRADRVLIGRFWGLASVGLYQAAFTIAHLFREMLLIPVLNSVYPRMAQTYGSDRAAFNKLFEKINLILVIMTLPVAIFGFLFAEPMLQIFYGTAFHEAGHIFQRLIWIVPFMFLSVLWSHVFIVQNRQEMILWLRALALAFNLAFNWFCLPKWGVVASAWAAVSSQALILLVEFWILRREDLFTFLKRVPRIVAAGALAGALAYFLERGDGLLFRFFVPAFVGALAYAGLSFLFRVFHQEEIDWLKHQSLAISKSIATPVISFFSERESPSAPD